MPLIKIFLALALFIVCVVAGAAGGCVLGAISAESGGGGAGQLVGTVILGAVAGLILGIFVAVVAWRES